MAAAPYRGGGSARPPTRLLFDRPQHVLTLGTRPAPIVNAQRDGSISSGTYAAAALSSVGAAGVGVAVTARSEGRGRRGTGIVARAVGLSAAVFAALLALEMWRTWELHDPDLQRSLGGFLRALLHV